MHFIPSNDQIPLSKLRTWCHTLTPTSSPDKVSLYNSRKLTKDTGRSFVVCWVVGVNTYRGWWSASNKQQCLLGFINDMGGYVWGDMWNQMYIKESRTVNLCLIKAAILISFYLVQYKDLPTLLLLLNPWIREFNVGGRFKIPFK